MARAHLSEHFARSKSIALRSLPAAGPIALVIPDAEIGAFLTAHERQAIEHMIERLIAILDAADGDTDLESEGAEDDFHIPAHQLCLARGAGCPVSDPDYGVDDEPEMMEYIMSVKPRYQADQSLGPLNYAEACAVSDQIEAERYKREYDTLMARRRAA